MKFLSAVRERLFLKLRITKVDQTGCELHYQYKWRSRDWKVSVGANIGATYNNLLMLKQWVGTLGGTNITITRSVQKNVPQHFQKVTLNTSQIVKSS